MEKNNMSSHFFRILFVLLIMLALPLPGSADMIYVANVGTHQILGFSSDGAQLGNQVVASGLSYPTEGLAFDISGNLYYANESIGTIGKITPSGVSSVFVNVGSGVNPVGLAFDSSGNLYTANLNGTISEISPTGNVSTFASTGLNNPYGLAFDIAGNLYVANYGYEGTPGSNTITKITPSGVSSVFATGLAGPTGLAFDSSGNLYVAEEGGIEQFTSSGIGSVFATITGTSLYGLTFDSSGNLYAGAYQDNVIIEITPGGVQSDFATYQDGVSLPTFIAIQPGLSFHLYPNRAVSFFSDCLSSGCSSTSAVIGLRRLRFEIIRCGKSEELAILKKHEGGKIMPDTTAETNLYNHHRKMPTLVMAAQLYTSIEKPEDMEDAEWLLWISDDTRKFVAHFIGVEFTTHKDMVKSKEV